MTEEASFFWQRLSGSLFIYLFGEGIDPTDSCRVGLATAPRLEVEVKYLSLAFLEHEAAET
jgi:hypothetical protein